MSYPMTEPVYEYIKGKGWVVQLYETYTNTYKGHTVTIIKRPPEPHERGWYAYSKFSSSLESVFRNIRSHDRDPSELGWEGSYHYEKLNHERDLKDVKYVVTVVVS